MFVPCTTAADDTDVELGDFVLCDTSSGSSLIPATVVATVVVVIRLVIAFTDKITLVVFSLTEQSLESQPSSQKHVSSLVQICDITIYSVQ